MANVLVMLYKCAKVQGNQFCAQNTHLHGPQVDSFLNNVQLETEKNDWRNLQFTRILSRKSSNTDSSFILWILG